MLKRVGVMALMLCGGALFLHPAAAFAQEYRGWNGYAPQYRSNDRYYRDNRREEREWREPQWREERRERAWRAQEWREHERWENGRYASPYAPAPRPYYGSPY